VNIFLFEPGDLNGLLITEYKVEFLKSNGDYVENKSLCDGADATVIANMKCVVGMEDLKLYTGKSAGSQVKV